MILLVTPATRARDCAAVIEQITTQPTRCAATSQEASALLRAGEYAAVVFDQLLLDAEPEQAEQLMELLGRATPVFVNCALHSAERIARQVRSAVERRKGEEQRARASAESALRGELSETITALLLSCDMALSMTGLPQPAEDKLRLVHELATQLSTQLRNRPSA